VAPERISGPTFRLPSIEGCEGPLGAGGHSTRSMEIKSGGRIPERIGTISLEGYV
jgi:hypothetical protein